MAFRHQKQSKLFTLIYLDAISYDVRLRHLKPIRNERPNRNEKEDEKPWTILVYTYLESRLMILCSVEFCVCVHLRTSKRHSECELLFYSYDSTSNLHVEPSLLISALFWLSPHFSPIAVSRDKGWVSVLCARNAQPE